MRSWPRRFTLLFFVPLVAAVLAYLLTPLYSTQTLHLEGLVFTVVFEGAVIVQMAALLAVLRRPPLVVTALIVLSASAMLAVWAATMAMDGEAGLALAFPFVTGTIAAVVLGSWTCCSNTSTTTVRSSTASTAGKRRQRTGCGGRCSGDLVYTQLTQ